MQLEVYSTPGKYLLLESTAGVQRYLMAKWQALLNSTSEMPLYINSKILKSFKTLNYIMNSWIPHLCFLTLVLQWPHKDDRDMAIFV